MENEKVDIYSYTPTVHVKNRAVPEIWKKHSGLVVTSDFEIVIPEANFDMLNNSANDLQEYFEVSMGVSVKIRRSSNIDLERENIKNKIVISSESYGKLSSEPSEFTVNVANGGIDIRGMHMRDAMQGGFFVEDIMNNNEGPVIEEEKFHRKDRFSPRIVHVPTHVKLKNELAYCDDVIRSLAHHNLDLAFYVSTAPSEEQYQKNYKKYNGIIAKSIAWGIRPYFYSAYRSTFHPSEPGALEYYRSTYGALMKNCPGVFGIIFVGETVEFPSKDPRVNPYPRYDPRSNEDDRITAGWFPCCDYPEWINIVKRVIREQNPDCEFIFWSYNWAYIDADLRLELIRNLPKDITALATFEMAQEFYTDGGAYVRTDDYTLSYIGPSDYFVSELQEAHKRGLRMMSMTNSAGKTWDIAGVPYLLTPQRWNLRWQNIIKSQETYSLAALLESHNFGWRPSIISEIEKEVFRYDSPKFEVLLRKVVERDFMASVADQVIEAFALCGDALGHCIPSGLDQYGVSRAGPAYPFVFKKSLSVGEFNVTPDHYTVTYDRFNDDQMVLAVNEFKIMSNLFGQAAELLKEACDKVKEVYPEKYENIMHMYYNVEYCSHAALSASNYRNWCLMRRRYLENKEGASAVVKMREIIAAERENDIAAIPTLEADHMLGSCPSHDYSSTPDNMRAKIKQLDDVLNNELANLTE